MARNLNLPSPERRLDWIHRDNPDGKGQSWLLFDGDQEMPIASCSGIRRRYQMGGKKYSAILLADVNCNPEYRYALPSVTLQRAIREEFLLGEFQADFLLCGPNRSLAAVQKRAGMENLGTQTRWSKPIRLMRLRRLGRGYSFPTAIGADAMLAARRMLPARRSGEVEILEGLAGKEFDDLEHRLPRSPDALHPTRGTKFVQWRFQHHPFHFHEILTLRRSKVLQGYLVLNSRHDGARMVADLRVRDQADFQTLIQAAERHSDQSGAGALWMNLNSNSPYQPWLEAAGFRSRSNPIQITAQWRRSDLNKLAVGSLLDCDFDV